MDLRKALVVAVVAVVACLAGAPTAGAARLVFSSPVVDGLRTVEPDGTHLRELTRKDDSDPQWSPDRRQVLFDRCYSTAPSVEFDVCALYVTAAAGGDAHVVRRDATSGTWSPDGKRIAWTGDDDRIHLSRTDGSQPHRLWRGVHCGGEPAWSGPANRIAYTSYVCDDRFIIRAGLHIIKPDGYGDRLVTRDGFGADWSPDGRRLAYYGESGICVIHRDGTRRHCLQVGQPWGQQPAAWSPDGRWIAYTSEAGCPRSYSVYKIWSDGSDRKLVACGAGPDW